MLELQERKHTRFMGSRDQTLGLVHSGELSHRARDLFLFQTSHTAGDRTKQVSIYSHREKEMSPMEALIFSIDTEC